MSKPLPAQLLERTLTAYVSATSRYLHSCSNVGGLPLRMLSSIPSTTTCATARCAHKHKSHCKGSSFQCVRHSTPCRPHADCLIGNTPRCVEEPVRKQPLSSRRFGHPFNQENVRFMCAWFGSQPLCTPHRMHTVQFKRTHANHLARPTPF